MKVIHCADLHLDSKMTSHLNGEQAKSRKIELLQTFVRMVDYAQENQVTAILIAGDLFDTKNVLATARNCVQDTIRSHPAITFYYLKGNHDADSFLHGLEEMPDNLKLFGENWTTYTMGADGRIQITGVELQEETASMTFQSLVLQNDCFNIVMLHGQETDYTGKDKTVRVQLPQLRNKGIDYLALGHLHSYREDRLDQRGVYCYSGCLEGRGFDECGSCGFVLLEIDERSHTCQRQFVPFAARTLHTVEADITDCMTTSQIEEEIRQCLEQSSCKEKDLVKIVLTGSVDVSCEKNLEYLQKRFCEQFYFLKLSDETKLAVDVKSFQFDESLKGEFVRTVMKQENLTSERKAQIIRCGIQALAGEELD